MTVGVSFLELVFPAKYSDQIVFHVTVLEPVQVNILCQVMFYICLFRVSFQVKGYLYMFFKRAYFFVCFRGYVILHEMHSTALVRAVLS
jgi:hypothetical protein